LRVRWLLPALALITATPSPAQDAGPPWRSAEANLYWPLKAARVRAYRDGDRAFFERELADNFVTVDPNGRRLGRAEYLAAEFPSQGRSGLRPETEVRDFEVVRSGSTLILTYRERIRTAVGSQSFSEQLSRLDVYVRAGSRWRLQSMTAIPIPEAPATITLAPEALAEFAGAYTFGPDLISTVRIENGRMIEQTTGQQAGELLPIGRDLFYAPPDIVARVEFERDAAGRVIAQIYRSGSQVLRAPRRD
jgi:hypothetical protein